MTGVSAAAAKEVVRRFIEDVVSAPHLDLAEAIAHDVIATDFVNHRTALQTITAILDTLTGDAVARLSGRAASGRTGFLVSLRGLRDPFPYWLNSITDLHVDGDMVIGRWTVPSPLPIRVRCSAWPPRFAR